ncbi:unnamed protein product [Moneuplotes crassus]|uniref:Impact N-terminal domain-containing protein n=1 Tax=Euplotes crassus TaxID=5936 RepID=A0AAD1U5T1_EUPCR|nr:unnamed protein product [Moneuplotes crassus]
MDSEFQENTSMMGKDHLESQRELYEESIPSNTNEEVIGPLQYGSEIVNEDTSQRNKEEDEEAKAVIDSISQGKVKLFKKAKFQAFSAAISHEDHVMKVQDHLDLNHSKPTNSVVAFRVVDPSSNTGISEGFDDDGEEGSGEKLLRLLQKLGVENVALIVCVWHNNMPGHLGTDFYRMVLERARDLLTALHNEVMQQENSSALGGEFVNNEAPTMERKTVESKVFNIAQAVDISKGKETTQSIKSDAHKKFLEDNSINFLPQVDKLTYKESVQNLEKAGKSLTKGHIREFLSFVRPEPIIGKLFQVIAMIKGYKNPNWSKCRDLLSNPTFKIELLSFRGRDYDSENVLKAFKIFESSAISFTQKSPRKKDFYQKFYEILPKISDGSVHVFDWIISFFKAYSGYSKFGDLQNDKIELGSDIGEITMRTKMMMRQEMKKNRKPKQIKIKQTALLSPEERADKDYYRFPDDQTEDKKTSQVKPNIGMFLQNKQMMFGDDSLIPEEGKKSSLIDYNALKRGANFLIDEEEELRKREQLEQEQADRRMIMEKNSKFKVENLPNKTELMLETLKDIDYEEQPLEVLIALAERLKKKRMDMFPDAQPM